MIKSLKIANFQSHEKTNLVFHPGVNIIIGESDSGKSAIIRALRWVSRNKPSGDSVRSYQGGKTLVLLETEEGFVYRTKDKTDQYELHPNGGHNLLFKAFGTNVPEEIVTFLNLDEVNLQFQLDSHFLLSKSPGEVAAYFNKIAKLDKINKGLQNVNSWIRDLNSVIGQPATKDKPATGLIKQIADAMQALIRFDYLDKFEAELEVLEEIEKRYTTKIQRESSLNTLVHSIKSVDADIETASEILELEEPLNDVFSDMYDLEELRKQRHALSMAVQAIDITDTNIKSKQAALILEQPVNNLLTSYSELHKKIELYNNVGTLLDNITDTIDAIDEMKVLQTTLEERFEKEFPNICPLCGQEVKHGKT